MLTARTRARNDRFLRCSTMYTDRYTTVEVDDAGHGSRGAWAYAELKRQLLAGDHSFGSRLVEASLGRSLGVSRTPIRDALARLHAEGLVVRLAEGGYSPTVPDLHTVAELYEVRRHLEFGALHRGVHDPEQLRALAADWADTTAPASDRDCAPEFVLLDESFHLALAAAAGNHSLVEHLRRVNERIRLVRMHDFLTVDRVARTITEHRAIVATLLDGRPDAAARALAGHLDVSERVVGERAAAAVGRMLRGGGS